LRNTNTVAHEHADAVGDEGEADGQRQRRESDAGTRDDRWRLARVRSPMWRPGVATMSSVSGRPTASSEANPYNPSASPFQSTTAEIYADHDCVVHELAD
jgi:hypothetical protein